MAGGFGQRVVAGAEKALTMLGELPRISLANLKSNPKAFKQTKRGRGQHGGKKHGAGNKGSGQRQNFMRLGYETGNNPFYLRVPKEPYYKGHQVDITKPIDLAALCNTKLFKLVPTDCEYGFQLTDEGLDNFKAKINIEVQWAPEQVIAAIERNGGVITTAYYDPHSLLAIRDAMKFFARGVPIPKRQMPPEDAIEYYTDPKNRGYLADPDLVAEERFKLAQKYGYILPDLQEADADSLAMMLERKDPRQIFYGLNPAPDNDSSFSFVLSDVPKTSNAQSKSAHLQSTSRPTHQWEEPRFPADDSCDYSSSKTLPSSSRHRLSSVEFPPSPDQSQFVSSDNIGYDYASSSKTLPSSRHRLSSVEFPPSPEHGNYTTLPSSVVEERKLLQMVRHKPDSHPVSNLIDFGTPPNSPFNNKLMTSQQQQSFQYSTGSAGRSTRSENNESQLAQEFSQLASDLHDADTGVTMESGCLVEVCLAGVGRPLYGVVRWCGKARIASNSYNKSSHQLLVGVELEDEIDDGTDGSYLGHQYFRCPLGRGVFVPVRHCKLDSRFGNSVTDQASSRYDMSPEAEHGGPECPSVVGEVPPVGQFGDWNKLTGKFRGIQGHHNSCYLDATLFSMFTFTSIFDGLLFRPPTRDDLPQYEEVQRILREEIVNPLRQNHYVRADKVMKLRRLLQKLGFVTGLTTEEKDPEEFLHCLLSQTLKAEPFLKLSSGQEAYHHQLFVEKDEKLVMPSVQQLFEQSFLSSGIKLKEVPPTLIIQMPRFGKSYKMYPYVLPSSLLDITDVLENSPRQCIVCGHLAEMECQQCLGQCGTGLESISFCSRCLVKAHSHKKRTTHQAQSLQVPADFAALQEHCAIPRVYMELFAVVCIATSHYVAFVKCGPGPDAPWCFFDSMADRRGEQNGFNVPEVVPCPDLPRWLSDDWDKSLLQNNQSNGAGGVLLQALPKRMRSGAKRFHYFTDNVMLVG
uniref:ubiquitinyl hydrolase 1 n=1 Tax=Eubosmina coregoni TaxID=186181 RepID=A0A4Y7LND6_9CRUS|nr:EOG090X03LH [Eubosmina coregoni]SVE69706.1 EOG090X03LH [Eubosmina coregoni]